MEILIGKNGPNVLRACEMEGRDIRGRKKGRAKRRQGKKAEEVSNRLIVAEEATIMQMMKKD